MPWKPDYRRGDALDKALDYRWLHRRRPKRMKGHPRACRCYDCLFGPEGQPDPDWKEPRRRG